MLRIGWFSPISSKTGISSYSRNVLEEMRRVFPRDEIDVVVFYPPTDAPVVGMPYPTIELSESLLKSDFDALFDVAIYHVGNNALNHTPIYQALLKHPGLVVLHDYVYQHYLAGIGIRDHFISSSFAALIFEAGGPEAFDFLAESGVLRCDAGALSFVAWESEWSMKVPLGAQLARLGLGAVVHSDYSQGGLGAGYSGDVCKLFMPRPDFPALPPVEIPPNGRIHLVCCGHIQATKGLRLLTGAFLHDPELRDHFRVTISGFGSDEAFLELLRRELREGDLEAVFDLVVNPSEVEYVEVMSSADIYVNLRYPNTEGASLSLYEQLCLGRPVISYRTGSFAEVPDAACYFLDRIGDVPEVSALLGHISRNRQEIAAKGARARDAVEALTADRYASELVEFLTRHGENFSRRLGLFRARAEGRLPLPQAADATWLRQLVDARRVMVDFYDDALLLPDGLFEASDLERGRYISLNLLGIRMTEAAMERVGRLVGAVPPLKAVEVLGLLLLFDGRADYLPEHLGEVYLPICEGLFWEVLVSLPEGHAIPMALEALGMETTPELVRELLQEAGEKSVAQALHAFLKSRNSPLLRREDFADVLDVLEEVDAAALAALAPIPPGQNVIRMLAEHGRSDSLLLQGFHPAESIGIWTAKETACMFMRIAEGEEARELVGAVQFFGPGVVDGEVLIVEITEQATGRTKVLERRYAPGEPTEISWHLDLPGFKGCVKVMMSTQKLYSPKAVGVSQDPRNLGVMCRDLTLVTG